MASHIESCPFCYKHTMFIAETESTDVGYCEECGGELTRSLSKTRHVIPPEVSRRPKYDKPQRR